MFDLYVFQEPVMARQRAAVRDAVSRALKNRTFSYTEVLMADEPVRTFALEFLDGLSSESGMSAVKGEVQQVGPVRIVCIKPNDSIKTSKIGERRVLGTTLPGPPEDITETHGNDAVIDDSFPNRLARGVLRSRGWPIRNKLSRGANDGDVVEWSWLEREANKPDAPPEVTELYAALKERMKAQEAPSKQNRNAGAQAQAHL